MPGPRRRRVACLSLAFLLAVLLAVLAGCGGPAPPGPGSSWTIDAVDRSGAFGTITIERGDVIDLPARLRLAVPGATRGMLVHIAYAPDRGSDTGFGAFDWGAAVGDEEINEAGASFRLLGLDSQFDWPVEPHLGTQLAGGDEPLEGWFLVALSGAELGQRVRLWYQPLLRDLGNNASDNQLVTEIVIHDP